MLSPSLALRIAVFSSPHQNVVYQSQFNGSNDCRGIRWMEPFLNQIGALGQHRFLHSKRMWLPDSETKPRPSLNESQPQIMASTSVLFPFPFSPSCALFASGNRAPDMHPCPWWPSHPDSIPSPPIRTEQQWPLAGLWSDRGTRPWDRD